MNIAICIPTYGYSEAVEDVLNNSIDVYKRYDIDVFYFDSSEDDLTENIVKRRIDAGYNNLHYFRYDSSLSLTDKIEDIWEFSEYEGKKYDYVWPMKNRVFLLEDAIRYIKKLIETEDNDIIVIGQTRGEGLKTYVYEDVADFYGRWGWLVASLDVVIFNQKRMLENFDMRRLKMGVSPNTYKCWGLWIALFCRLAELDNPRVKFVYEDEVKKQDSACGKSLWFKSLFEVWVDEWINANNMLPDIYEKYKKQSIKMGISMESILGSEKRMHQLYQLGVFNVEELSKRKEIWSDISIVPYETALKIAHGIYFEPDILQTSDGEVVGLLLKIIDMIDNNKMLSSSIPFDEIATILYDRYKQKTFCSTQKLTILASSMNYLKKGIVEGCLGKDEIKEVIFVLVNFFLLLN